MSKPKGAMLPVIIALVLIVRLANAADQTGSAEEEAEAAVMKEVVVTASRYEEEVETVPANVTVITEDQIANSTAKDIPSLLQKEVGMHVYDITGNGRSYRVDRAGFGETAQLNTLVLVDGRRVNNPDLSGTDWLLIPLSRVKRIEIIRGGRGSVLYGDNATNGVVNILTKEGEQLEAGISGAAGSYSTVSSDAYLSGSHKKLAYALSGRYYDTDGYRDNSDLLSRNVGVNLDYWANDWLDLKLASGYHDDDAGLPGALRQSDLDAGFGRRDTANPNNFSETEDYYVEFGPEIYFLRDNLFKTPVSWRQRETSFFFSFLGGQFQGDTDLESVGVSPQFVVNEPLFGFKNNLTVGFDYRNDDQDITNESIFGPTFSIANFDLEKKNYGFYALNEIYLLRNLALSVGARYDDVEFTFSPTRAGTPDKIDFDENPLTVGVNYNFYKNSFLYFSFSQSFRYPALDEIYNFFNNTISSDLKPQTSDNYEFGLRHFFSKRLYANVNFYRLDTQDEIFLNPETFANENFGAETRRDGIELVVGLILKDLSLEGTYTYRDTEIRGGAFDGNEVPLVPEHQASVNVVWAPIEGWSFAVNGIYVAERFLESDYANEYPKLGGYAVANAKIQYTWKKFTLFADVNNLFDREYDGYGVLATVPVEPAFFPSPEINFFAGVKFDY